MDFCSQLIIGIGINPEKKVLFSTIERLDMIHKVINSEFDFLTSTNIKAVSFNGLLVKFAKEVGASVIIRGIRSVSDFEYEINLANVNKTLEPSIETIFLPTSPNLSVVSSSSAKTIAKFGGNIESFVPKYVSGKLKEKLSE